MMPLSRFLLRVVPVCALLAPGFASAESATPAKATSTPKPTAAATPKATAKPAEKAAAKPADKPAEKPATDTTDATAEKKSGSGKSSAGIGSMGNMFGGGKDFDLVTGPKGTLSTTIQNDVLQKMVVKDPDGKVVITNPDFKLNCETLTYVEASKQAVALGNPVVVQQPGAKATCKKLEMYPGDVDSKFVLTGDPVLEQAGQGRASGEKITIIQHKDGSIDTFIDAPHVSSTGAKVSGPSASTPAAPKSTPQPVATPATPATIEIDMKSGALKNGNIGLPGLKPTTAATPKSTLP